MAMSLIEEIPLFIVFGSTLLMLTLHPLEWLKIRSYREETPTGLNANTRLEFLNRLLSLEIYYYLFVLVILIAFFRELLLLALVLVMAAAHVAASRDLSHTHSILRNNTHLTAVLAFDILELIFLLLLVTEFWPLIVPVL